MGRHHIPVHTTPGETTQVESHDLHLRDARSCGVNRGRGNLLGIQPYMTPADYAAEARFFARMDGYLAAAQEAGMLGERTVVVLPEYLGAWLVALGEAEAVRQASTLSRAMVQLALRHLPALLLRCLTAREAARATAALFRLKAPAMAAVYHRVCAHLSREYRVTLVAGSLILPNPSLVDGRLLAGDGPLYNVSVLYGPEGRAHSPLVRKVYPTADEQPFLHAGSVDDLPVFATPAGRLGILICADAWFPACYARLRAQNVDIIAVPSYAMHGDFSLPWSGYSGFPPPADVDPADIGRLTRREAWRKYALEGRLPLSGATAAINVFLHGRLWDLPSAGQTVAVNSGHTYKSASPDAALLNIWL